MAYSALYYFWLILISSSSPSPPLSMDSSPLSPSSLPALPVPVPRTHTPVFHIVGDNEWISPQVNGFNYAEWSSGLTFYVGDQLVFKYKKGFDNVFQVTEKAYQTCNKEAPLAIYDNGGTTLVTLNKSGMWYFICGIGSHCNEAQKVSLLVKPEPSPMSPPSSPLPLVSSPFDNTVVPSPPLAPFELPFTSTKIPFLPHPASTAPTNLPSKMFWFMIPIILHWVVNQTL